jgi:hypothetical protein
MNLPLLLQEKVVRHINRKRWWHVPPRDPTAYRKRGQFLASSFAEAEFWGRPLNEAQRVKVARPLVGDEELIERNLFGRILSSGDITMEKRWALDARMKKEALRQGYDSIVLMSAKAFAAFKKHGKVPRRIELNVLRPGSASLRKRSARA